MYSLFCYWKVLPLMKRSEAVYAISKVLFECAPEHYNSQSSYSRRLDAEAILTKLEYLGMKAPQYHVEENGLVTPLKTETSIALNYWEPE